MAHTRRNFHDLHASYQSHIATEALELFGARYGAERDVAELPADEYPRYDWSEPNRSPKRCIGG